MNMEFYRKLPIPMEIKEQFPLSEAGRKRRDETIEEMKNIFAGKSDRFLLIIGPCSADSEESVLDYIRRLKKIQEKVSDKIIIIPRIYTNKPRTTGQGYKGMLHQPDPQKESDMLKGVIAIRNLQESEASTCVFAITVSTHSPFNRIRNNQITTTAPPLLNRYMQCLNYTDSCIGDFMDYILNDPKLAQSTIVITSDHTIFKPAMLPAFSCNII